MEVDSFLLRARVVVPVTRPPIHDGAVFVSGDRIQDVGPWDKISSNYRGVPCTDLSDQILLPGLINAHCHLDYTRMAGGIPPKKSFSDWIKAILAYKADWSYTDFAESWVAGAKMLLRTGTTTVLDVEAVPELLEEAWSSTPLRVVSALEMTGIRSGKNPATILEETIRSIPSPSESSNTVALSPHSLYSTQPELVQLAAQAATQHNWLLTTHVSESTEEMDMFLRRKGPMFNWLKKQRDMADCNGESPVEILCRLGVLSDRFIAVHGNCLSVTDMELLAGNHCSLVHCPRSHDYFCHPRFQFEQLKQFGVNLCLGTDSLASVRGTSRLHIELDMFREMQALANNKPDVAAESILRMSTVNGARALGRSGEIGEIAENALADLIAVPYKEGCEEPYRAIVENVDAATFVMIDGTRVI